MRIGIYLPYRHCEATYMGLRLASLAARQEHQPSLLAAGGVAHSNGVDCYWDRHAPAHRNRSFDAWVRALDCVVFLTMSCQADVAKAKLVQGKRSMLVANWHNWNAKCPPGLFTEIVCPSKASFVALTEQRDGTWPQLLYVPWDAGTPRIHRYKVRDSDFLRIYVPVDAYTLDKTATSVVYVLGRLLETHRQARFTLATFKSVPRQIASTIKALERTGKLSWEKFPSYQRQLRLLHANDLTWVPSLRSEAGWFSLQSVEAGVPVIAYDVPPAQEFLRQDVNAQLVTCDIRLSDLGAAEAVPSIANVLRHLSAVLDHPRPLQNIWQTQENQSVRRSNFHSMWSRLWSGNYDGVSVV